MTTRVRPGWPRVGAVAVVLAAVVAAGCSSSTSSSTPAAAAPPAKASFGNGLSLAISFASAPAAGDKSVKTDFALTNNGASTFEGCFGQAWGLSVIVQNNHDAGYIVRASYPKCEEKLTLLPRQTIVWSKTVPLRDLRAGPAKVTGWVRIVDPKACTQAYGCRDVSIASRLTTMTIGAR